MIDLDFVKKGLTVGTIISTTILSVYFGVHFIDWLFCHCGVR